MQPSTRLVVILAANLPKSNFSRRTAPLDVRWYKLSCSYATAPKYGVKDTSPSTSRPPSKSNNGSDDVDEGYLTFTRASLYKLTLPLSPSSSQLSSRPNSSREPPEPRGSTNPPTTQANSADTGEARARSWEQDVEDGNDVASRKVLREEENDEVNHSEENAPAQSVVFLLHPGQPLSYLSSLIHAEGLYTDPAAHSSSSKAEDPSPSPAAAPADPHPERSITFHIGSYPLPGPAPGRRWSPATGLGDFLHAAARAGSFTLRLGASRRVCVHVPSFAARTRFLRTTLAGTTREIERMAGVKEECDRAARHATQRVAFAGAGVLGVWWVTVGYLTFVTELGWDTMEPITYLTGLGTVISGYLWFLWHNREVSYSTVLTETTSRRQQKLYSECGFDGEHFSELVGQARRLRREIKRVAADYGLEWDQGDTELGQHAGRALGIIRKVEARVEKNGARHGRVDEDEGDEEEEALFERLTTKDDEKPR